MSNTKTKTQQLPRLLADAGLVEDVMDWFLDDQQSLAEIVSRLERDHGITTSASAVSRFCSRSQFSWRLKRSLEIAKDFNQEVPEGIAGELRKSVLGRVQELAFAELSEKALIALYGATQEEDKLDLQRRKIEINARALEQAERKLKLLEEKHAALVAQARETAGDSSLSEEEKAARYREIFGMA